MLGKVEQSLSVFSEIVQSYECAPFNLVLLDINKSSCNLINIYLKVQQTVKII